MAVGGVLGAISGGVLGALDLIHPWAWAILFLGMYLLAFSFLDGSSTTTRELAGALSKALAGVAGGVLGLALLFSVPLGVLFALDAAFSLPPWGGWWDRYPNTAQYLVEAVGTLIVVGLAGSVLKPLFDESDAPWLDWLAAGIVGGLAGGAISALAVVPLLPVILPVGLLDAWPGGALGALVGGLLGGAYGTLVGGLAKFVAVDMME